MAAAELELREEIARIIYKSEGLETDRPLGIHHWADAANAIISGPLARLVRERDEARKLLAEALANLRASEI